ncbi:MAG: DUF4926 domain-containing protein [Phycisphaerales bacterium]|nr:DUF4926 domain-containing protein [Phycisphaerales bacterium]
METTIVIRELDRVVLATNLRKHGLKRGDVGTVVLKHGSRGYEVEFITLDGRTVAVVSVTTRQVRRIAPGEIAHARPIQVA